MQDSTARKHDSGPRPVPLDEIASIDAGPYFRRLVWLAIISCLVLLVSSSLGIYRLHTKQVTRSAELVSIDLARSLAALDRDAFNFVATSEDGECLEFDDSARLRFEQTLRLFLVPFDIYKVKIYDCNRRIVYSTENHLIGRVDSANGLLLRALQGRVASKLVRKEQIVDLNDERRFDVDVVESYVPIGSDPERPAGVFELYVDVNHFRYEGYMSTFWAVTMITVFLVVIFCVAWLIARQIGGRLQQAQNRLHELATTDPLTGVATRGEILHRLRDETDRLRRSHDDNKRALSLLMVDVDHFKQVNDHYGHLAGDRVLREIAERLAQRLRRYDLVGRYGGEEFLLVLPDTDFDAALAIAERMRTDVDDRVASVGELEIRLTVSVGVATLRAGEDDYVPALKRADDGLYLAKKSGRNRVCYADGEGDG